MIGIMDSGTPCIDLPASRPPTPLKTMNNPKMVRRVWTRYLFLKFIGFGYF